MTHIKKEERLSLTFRAVKDVHEGTTGICPTTLVFGVHPKLPGSGSCGNVAQRVRIVSDCTSLVRKLKAREVTRRSQSTKHSDSVLKMETVR